MKSSAQSDSGSAALPEADGAELAAASVLFEAG
jgi:hypothetical protein